MSKRYLITLLVEMFKITGFSRFFNLNYKIVGFQIFWQSW